MRNSIKKLISLVSLMCLNSEFSFSQANLVYQIIIGHLRKVVPNLLNRHSYEYSNDKNNKNNTKELNVLCCCIPLGKKTNKKNSKVNAIFKTLICILLEIDIDDQVLIDPTNKILECYSNFGIEAIEKPISAKSLQVRQYI